MRPGPDEALFYNPHRRRTLISLALLPISCGLAALMLVVGLGLAAALLTGILGLTLGGILALIFWLTGRSVEPSLAAMRRGEWLARWEIDRSEWMAWSLARQRKRSRGGAIAGLLVGLGAGLAALAMFFDGDVVAGGVTTGLALAAGLGLWASLAFTGGREPRGVGPLPLVITPRMAVTPGAMLAWSGPGARVLGCSVDAARRVLCINYVVTTGHGSARHEQELPVPPDKLDEAERVAEAIREA